jgi:hypothetical protein
MTASRVTPRGKIAVLLPNGWLYGTVNRGEFSRAIAPESHRTFKLSKQAWAGPRRVVTVKGSHVSAWDWLTPAPPKRKRAAKPSRPAITTPAEISDEDREALAAHMAGARG